MPSPYQGLESRAFWNSAISKLSPLELADIYAPKFQISKKTKICAAGSCFAQHIGRQFKRRCYTFLDVEKPIHLMEPEFYQDFGFDMYSARYGNIYSVRQLLQLFKRANGEFEPLDSVWEKDGRFYDPFRPTIEPKGFASKKELLLDRNYHLGQVNKLLASTQLFVFTFGLTEAWINTEDGAVLPTCPGTVAGEYDRDKYHFHNFTHAEVLADTIEFIALARSQRPSMKFLFTVSPVPLTATASGDHVLPATVYSKSVLRGVCGELVNELDCVDYFPSYELVSSHPMRAMFYNPNLRSVADKGVAHVMNVFFDALGDTGSDAAPTKDTDEPEEDADRIACEEILLEAFGE